MSESWFDNWFERFWNVYTTKLCSSKGASFEIAKKRYKTKIKSKLKADEILATLLAQVRYKLELKEAKEHQSKWVMPGILVYLNQERWSGFTIGNHSDIDDRPSQADCGCGRGQPIAYARENMCSLCRHEVSRKDHRKEIAYILEKMGLYNPGETQERLNQKCKKYLLENRKDVIYNLKVKNENLS